MTQEFQRSKPIYRQIADQIAYQIVRGEMSIGEKLPSVREMAIKTSVNPNTIQKTYNELEGMGIVETKRGQGTFVKQDESVLERLKNQLQTELIAEFVKNMGDLGFTQKETLQSVEIYLGGESID